MHLSWAAIALLLQQAHAQRQADAAQAVFAPQEDMDFVDSGYYYGISTFAHTRYVNCFSDAESRDKLYDIAIIGAPHDTVNPLDTSSPMIPSTDVSL